MYHQNSTILKSLRTREMKKVYCIKNYFLENLNLSILINCNNEKQNLGRTNDHHIQNYIKIILVWPKPLAAQYDKYEQNSKNF